MGQIVPDAVESYLASLNTVGDELLGKIAARGAAEHLPLVDAEVGALLRILALSAKATKILEIGTAIGYSGIWLAGALPSDGLLLTIEKDADRGRVARTHFEQAGLADRVNVMIGDASLLLAKIAGPFDLIFQDGAKTLYGKMLNPLVDRLRLGGLLITDNVLWDGEVVPGFVDNPKRNAEDTRAIGAYNLQISQHPQLLTSIVPLRDGLAISVKRQ